VKSLHWKSSLHRWIRLHRSHPVVRWAAAGATSLLRAVNNDSDHLGSNGESFVLDRLPKIQLAVDCGANVGSWTAALTTRHPDAHVHCFEIHPGMASELRKRFADSERVTVHGIGLSDTAGDVEITFDPNQMPVTSLVETPDRRHWARLVARVDRLDHVLDQRVDLLKIDAEGHDLEVLRGASGLLDTNRIDVVQFEFTLWAAIARHWLADFYDELVPRGYRVGKLFPDGVEWRDYSPMDEAFERCNFVAVRAGRADLIELLSCPIKAPRPKLPL